MVRYIGGGKGRLTKCIGGGPIGGLPISGLKPIGGCPVWCIGGLPPIDGPCPMPPGGGAAKLGAVVKNATHNVSTHIIFFMPILLFRLHTCI